jgi:hypothetical protein
MLEQWAGVDEVRWACEDEALKRLDYSCLWRGQVRGNDSIAEHSSGGGNVDI